MGGRGRAAAGRGLVVRPLLHQYTAALEQVGPGICLFRGVAQDMGKCRLRYGPRRVSLLQRPVLEAAAEPVHCGSIRQPGCSEYLGQCHVGHGHPRLQRGGKDQAALITQCRCSFKYLHCLYAEGHSMLLATLHTSRGYPPCLLLHFYLVPPCSPGLTGARCGEHQKSETELGCHRGLRPLYRLKCEPDLLVGQRPEVCLHLGHVGQGTVYGLSSWVAIHETVRHPPAEHCLHPLTHSTRRLGSGCPYRGEDSQHLAPVYPVQWEIAQPGYCMTLQGLHPARYVLGVAPAGYVRLMRRSGRLPEGGHGG